MPKLRERITSYVEHPWFTRTIIALIVLNAISLGLETSAPLRDQFGTWLHRFDLFVVTIFVCEIILRIVAYGHRFFRDPWSLFDLIVVSFALAPTGNSFSVLRSLRVLRIMRLASVVPRMRRIIEALLDALPGLGSVIAILLLIFYISGVMATNLFGSAFPQWFGDLGKSAYSLFQIMTLESWSMGIVRPVMQVYPFAWAFFVPFILVATFTMLNLFIAVVVNAMQSRYHDEEAQQAEAAHEERELLLSELRSLRQEVHRLNSRIS